MLPPDEFDELIPIYALGGLSRAEQRRMASHLKECETCRKRYAEEQAIVNMLPRGIESVQPSSETKRKLFERIERDLAQQQATTNSPIIIPAERAQPRRPWFAQPVFVFGVLVAVLVLALGIWTLVRNTPASDQQQIAQILSNPKVQTVGLKGTDAAPHASAQMFMVPGDAQAVLKVAGLQTLPDDKRYEFWFINAQGAQPSNLFTVNPDGTMTVLVKAKDKVETYNAWGVSIENKAGATSPTANQIVILGGG